MGAICHLCKHRSLKTNKSCGRDEWKVSPPPWGHSFKTGRSGCFFYCTETNTESQVKWRHREICSKWVNKIKTSQKILKETEISNLPNKRVQINGHQDAHWTGKTNGWKQWNLQQRVENIQSMDFSRPEHQRGYPFPSLADLPNPGIKPRSPALQADSLPAEP